MDGGVIPDFNENSISMEKIRVINKTHYPTQLNFKTFTLNSQLKNFLPFKTFNFTSTEDFPFVRNIKNYNGTGWNKWRKESQDVKQA